MGAFSDNKDRTAVRSRRRLAAFGAAAITASVGFASGASGLYAEATDTKSTSGFLKSGTVLVEANGVSENSFSDFISGVAPGKTVSGSQVEVKNSGSLAFGAVDASITANGTLLDSPKPPTLTYTVTDDLGNRTTKTGSGGTPATISLVSCSVPWSGDACSGTRRVELSAGTWTAKKLFSLNGATGLKPGQSVWLKTFVSLPSSAGQEYAGATAQIQYAMTAKQRDPKTSNTNLEY